MSFDIVMPECFSSTRLAATIADKSTFLGTESCGRVSREKGNFRLYVSNVRLASLLVSRLPALIEYHDAIPNFSASAALGFSDSMILFACHVFSLAMPCCWPRSGLAFSRASKLRSQVSPTLAYRVFSDFVEAGDSAGTETPVLPGFISS